MHKVSSERPKKRLRLLYNNSGRLLTLHWQYRTDQRDRSQQEYPGLECRFGPSGPNRHLQDTHPKSTEYTFFSAPHCTYSKTDHTIVSKSLLSKCKRIKIITNTLSEHNAFKLQLRNNKTLKPHSNMETGQLAPECWLDKQWNEGRNKDVLWNQWEWRHKVPESLGNI